MKSAVTNRINRLFEKNQSVLSIYFTAGFPALHDTTKLLMELQRGGADMVEVGIPFSDPVADGPTIQQSNQAAIQNGITLEVIFKQLEGIQNEIKIPVLLMGYFNNIYRFGVEEFCKRCYKIGIDAVIIPDLPINVYLDQYASIFKKYQLHFIFLVTPQTKNEHIRRIDKETNSFIYLVSASSVTGARKTFDKEQVEYFQKVKAMNLKNPSLIGFGISNHATFRQASEHAEGAIIGSAFIRLLERHGTNPESIHAFISEIKEGSTL